MGKPGLGGGTKKVRTKSVPIGGGRAYNRYIRTRDGLKVVVGPCHATPFRVTMQSHGMTPRSASDCDYWEYLSNWLLDPNAKYVNIDIVPMALE